MERGAAKVYIRRWQLYPEGDPTSDRNSKWLIPYAYDEAVPEDYRNEIDIHLADFARQTCTKPIRISESSAYPKEGCAGNFEI